MSAPSSRRVPALLAGVGLALLPACAGLAADREPATAQRPTFATDSATTTEGTFELELGLASDPPDMIELPVTVKYGLGPRSELFAGRAVHRRERVGGDTVRGRGDVELGWRHRLLEDPDAQRAAAVQLAVSVPRGSRTTDLGSGEYDLFAAAILDGRSDTCFWTAYYQLGLLGAPDGSGRDTQHALSLVAGRPLSEDLDGFVEVFGEFTRARGENPVSAMTGVAWTNREDVVYDLAFQAGLNGDAPDAQVIFGVTLNLGR